SDLVPQRGLIEVGQHHYDAAHFVVVVGPARLRRQRGVGRFIVVDRQPQLLQVVLTLRSPRGFPRLLHGRQQQRDQDRNDGDHHQKFDERKPALISFHFLRPFLTFEDPSRLNGLRETVLINFAGQISLRLRFLGAHSVPWRARPLRVSPYKTEN